MLRSRARAQRAAYLYASALITVHFLFLPCGGYERIMEGKLHCFLLLAVPFLLSVCFLAPDTLPRKDAMPLSALAYLLCSAASALCSPYGSAVLLGGTRYDGLVSIALYVLGFISLAFHLRADRRLIGLAAAAVTLCDVLILIQIAGYNPLALYPAGLGYRDGDIAYTGFYAGTPGNIDFTAFLLALALSVFLAALIRLRLLALAPTAALTLYVLWRLDVAAAWVGLAAAAVWSLALLFPRRKRRMLALSAVLTAAVLILVYLRPCGSGTLSELSRVLHGDFDPAFGSGRIAIWKNCLPLVRERPLLGGGPDTLGLRGLPPFSWLPGGEEELVYITSAHNEYLNILVNQGALALIAYLALLFSALARCFARADKPRFALCGTALLCYGAMAMFSISTPITAPFVWLLLAIAASGKTDRQ